MCEMFALENPLENPHTDVRTDVYRDVRTEVCPDLKRLPDNKMCSTIGHSRASNSTGNAPTQFGAWTCMGIRQTASSGARLQVLTNAYK